MMLVGGAALAALVWWALRPQPVPVETAEVTRGPFEQVITDDGRTRVRDRYVVSAPLRGRLERIQLRVGDAVRAGDVVAMLADTPPALLDPRAEQELAAAFSAAQARSARAAADAARVEAQLAQARADRNRTAKLAADGFVSAAALEQAQLAVRTAERSLEAARLEQRAALHEAEQARVALGRFRADGKGPAKDARWPVRSPASGSVLRIMQESEASVAQGAPLLEIGDPRSLEVILDVLTQEAVEVRPGMPARLDLGAAAPMLSARVRHVEPGAFTKISALGVEEQRVNVVLDFAEPLDTIRTIGDGYRVQGQIVVYRVEDAVRVPLGALVRADGGWSVFVIEEGIARQRPVKVARRGALDAMIESGVQPGETVVVYPSDALRDGARVTLRDERR
jgi:HlyD family secretion protein